MIQRQTMLANTPRRGGYQGDSRPSYGEPGPPVFIPPPPVLAPTQEDVAACMLMELSLLSETAAKLVSEHLPEELIPETPVGEVLDLVLADAEKGDWPAAVAALRRRDDLLANPDIGRILLSHQHDKLNPEAFEEKEQANALAKLEKAVTECVMQLRIRQLERRIMDNQQAQATAADEETARRLQREHFEMIMEKQRLRQGIGD
jgi:hypothetical protein